MNNKFLFSTLAIAAMTATQALAQEQAVTSNAGMETWGSASYGIPIISPFDVNFPEGWSGSDGVLGQNYTVLALMGVTPQNQIFKSTDKHQGSFAAEIKTKAIGTLGVFPGVLTNTNISLDLSSIDTSNMSSLMNMVTFSGGTPTNGKKVDSVIAWVKLAETNTDSANITISAMKKFPGSDTLTPIGGGTLNIAPNANGYQRMAVAMTYASEEVATDTLWVNFLSSTMGVGGDSATVDNTLLVDDVSMILSDPTTAIEVPIMGELAMKVYPNPAQNGWVYFNLNT